MTKTLFYLITLILLLVGNSSAENTSKQIECEENFLYIYEDYNLINYCKNIELYLDLQKTLDNSRKELIK